MPSSSLNRRRLLSTAAWSALGSTAPRVLAQPPAAGAYPVRPVKLVIPFPAGGATDFAGRAIGQALSDLWRQPVVFDNRSGAGSTLGTLAGARSAPDGYTLVMGVPAGVSIAPHIYPKLGYDPQVDLLPAGGFASSPLLLVVPSDSPYRSLGALIADAKARPGQLSYASNGSGSLPHLATEWFLSQAGIKVVHVPYRGSAQALPDLMAGRTQMMIDIIVSSLPLAQGGKLRPLAVTAPERSSLLPDVPTVAESGYPGFAIDQWYGLFAPAGTPQPIVSQIERDLKTVTDDVRVRGLMWQRGAQVRYTAAKPFAAYVKTDSERWGVVARAIGATAE